MYCIVKLINGDLISCNGIVPIKDINGNIVELVVDNVEIQYQTKANITINYRNVLYIGTVHGDIPIPLTEN